MDDELHRHLIQMGREHWWYRGRRRVIRSVIENHSSHPPDGLSLIHI